MAGGKYGPSSRRASPDLATSYRGGRSQKAWLGLSWKGGGQTACCPSTSKVLADMNPYTPGLNHFRGPTRAVGQSSPGPRPATPQFSNRLHRDEAARSRPDSPLKSRSSCPQPLSRWPLSQRHPHTCPRPRSRRAISWWRPLRTIREAPASAGPLGSTCPPRPVLQLQALAPLPLDHLRIRMGC